MNCVKGSTKQNPKVRQNKRGHVKGRAVDVQLSMNHVNILRAAGVLLLLIGVASATGNTLLGEGRMFLRFTNTREDEAAVRVRLNIVPNNNQPFTWNGKTVYVGRDGAHDQANEAVWLTPGERSPWVDVGAFMSLRGTRSYDTYLSALMCGIQTQPISDGLHVLVEVAEGRGVGVIRRVDIHKPEVPASTPARVVPWNLGWGTWNHGPFLATVCLLTPTRPDVQPRIYTLEEMLKWQMDVIEEFPDTGRIPSQLLFRGRVQPEIGQALGYRDPPDDRVLVSLGDEISIHLKTPEEEINRRFREHLKGKGIEPQAGLDEKTAAAVKDLPLEEQWQAVTWNPLPDRPEQFYESAMFRYGLWYEELAVRTREAQEKNPGKTVYAGANFSPHMNVWPDTRQWVDPFRCNAMTMTWTEDWWWQLPECSPQVYGWLLTGLRLGGSYHGLPMQYYIMPFKGSSPDNIRRQHGLAFSQGAKIINHFVMDGQALITWDYVDYIESPRTFQVLHDMIRDAGAVEHRLFPAQPLRSKIAIMLSDAADTWDTEDLGGVGHLYGAQYNVNNDERKALWLALRHAQYPVDCILDADIAEGGLAGRDVLYIVGSEMLRAAVAPLMDWVRQGGRVYATGGCGLLDEYRRPILELLDLYGLESQSLDRVERHIRPRKLPTVKPLDTVKFKTAAAGQANEALEAPALLYRQVFKAVIDTEVIGRYASGEPAAVAHAYGKGQTLACGALMGLAYITPAMPPSSQILPTNFPASVRNFITALPREAGVLPPVQTSDPLVESQYMSGPEGDLVILTNWRETPNDSLVVRFPGRPEVRRVRSLSEAGYFKGHFHEQDLGELKIETIDAVPQVTLPVGVIDYLLVDFPTPVP